jgi:hypothetical protein
MQTDTNVLHIAGPDIAPLSPREARRLVDSMRGLIEMSRETLYRLWLGQGWVALDYQSWDALCLAEFGGVRLYPPARQEVVGWLHSQQMSTRAIASAVRVSDVTVRRDLQAMPVRVLRAESPASASGASYVAPPSDSVIGVDGKTYPVRRRTASPLYLSHNRGVIATGEARRRLAGALKEVQAAVGTVSRSRGDLTAEQLAELALMCQEIRKAVDQMPE